MRSWTKIWETIGLLRPFMRPYTKWLVRGTAITLGLVLLRLALPWPLKGVIEVLLPHPKHHGSSSHLAYLPSWGDPILWFVGAYVVLALGVAIAELLQRVCMAKFATHAFHDLRAAAVRGAVTSNRGNPGDLIARIIGDTARVKESLKGILVHASQHGLYFVGVWIVFMFISPMLSLFFLVGGLIAAWVGVRLSSSVASVFKKQRKKEGALATAIHEGLEHDALGDLDALNRSSANKDVRVTKLITLSSVIVHVVLAATTGAAVWFGTQEVREGVLSAGDLFLFITYSLAAHHRIVQVGRQFARAGKVVACTARISSLIAGEGAVEKAPEAKPLAASLQIESVALDSPRGRPRIDAIDLTVRAGSKIAVLGDVGSGKSSLLRLLAGVERADRGKILWDGEDLAGVPEALAARVDFLPQEPVIPRCGLWTILGMPSPEAPSQETIETLKKIGAWKIVAGMSKSLAEKVSSSTLSRNETRILRLGGIVLGNASMWLLDSPFQGMGLGRSRRCLDEIVKRLGNRTLMVSMARPTSLERFDRVLWVKDGKITFDGHPHEWKERRLLKG